MISSLVPAQPVRELLEQLYAVRSKRWLAGRLGKNHGNLPRIAAGARCHRAFAEAVEALAREVLGGESIVELRCDLPIDLIAAVTTLAEKRNVSVSLALTEILRKALERDDRERSADEQIAC